MSWSMGSPRSMESIGWFTSSCTQTMIEAIRREKQIKKWYREWKINLIEKENPEWRDLWSDIIGE